MNYRSHGCSGLQEPCVKQQFPSPTPSLQVPNGTGLAHVPPGAAPYTQVLTAESGVQANKNMQQHSELTRKGKVCSGSGNSHSFPERACKWISKLLFQDAYQWESLRTCVAHAPSPYPYYVSQQTERRVDMGKKTTRNHGEENSRWMKSLWPGCCS